MKGSCQSSVVSPQLRALDMAVNSCGFECVARADARVLILGTLPGKVSLERGEYYAQPRNAFWRIMGELAGASPDLPYQHRLRLLKQNGIALWDVCAAGCRFGSIDSAIRLSTVEPNDLSGFLQAHPGVELVCFNGKKANEIYARKVRQEPRILFERIRYEVLPSTSPAHAGMSFEHKLSHWRNALGERISLAPKPPEEVATYSCSQGSLL